MTAPTNQRPTPIAGPTFRAVAQLHVEGRKRRKVLALIAAYADAGQTRPTMAELSERLHLDERQVYALIQRLIDDGYLERHERRTKPRVRYVVVLPETSERL